MTKSDLHFFKDTDFFKIQDGLVEKETKSNTIKIFQYNLVNIVEGIKEGREGGREQME